MTNRDAITRLATNLHDVAARLALYENNTAVVDEHIQEFFGTSENGVKARNQLLLRLADRCRLYPKDEDADLWIEHSIEIEAARLYKAVVREAKAVAARA